MNEADTAAWYARAFPGYWRVIDRCVEGWQIDSKGMSLDQAIRSVLP